MVIADRLGAHYDALDTHVRTGDGAVTLSLHMSAIITPQEV
jgi:hypothetical protein